MHIANGHTLKALAILTIRLLNNNGSTLFNPSVLPWSTALHPSALKMTVKDLKMEIKR
jgi:hypothetical protein